MGLNPLYWGFNKDRSIMVASEMKALEGVCDRFEIFPPGHCFSNKTGLQKWYDRSWQTVIPTRSNLLEVTADIKSRLEEACRKRLMADVPIAFLLSGGLDSSLICSIIKRLYKNKEIHTFSIGIKGSPDLLAAQKVADFLQTTHHSYHFIIEDF